MGVTRNTVNQEADAHDDARAFLAAESGLFMLTDWLMQSAADGEILPRTGNITLDGISVALAIEQAGEDLPPDHWRLVSTAALPGLPYDKRIEWIVRGTAAPKGMKLPGAYGLILGTTDRAGFRDIAFDGPVHFNDGPAVLDHVDKVHFLRDVSVYVANKAANKTKRFGSLPRENDYTYGVVTAGGADIPVATLDKIFLAKFDPYAPKLYIGIDPEYTRVSLPANTSSLTFGVNAARPYYCVNNSCAEANRFYYDPDVPFILTDKLMTLAQTTPLVVTAGSMGGLVTVETTGRRDIKIDLSNGHLTYYWSGLTDSDLSADPWVTQGGFNSISKAGLEKFERNAIQNGVIRNDALAFYSAGNIIFERQNKDRLLTAGLFANNKDKTITVSGNGNGSMSLIGVASTDVFWNRDGNSGVKAIGGTWFSDNRAPGFPGVGFYDAEGNLIYEGEGYDGTSDTGPDILTNLPKIRWLETNVVARR
jgi:hypothetical protein